MRTIFEQYNRCVLWQSDQTVTWQTVFILSVRTEIKERHNVLMYCKLAATLRGSRPGVQSASLIMTQGRSHRGGHGGRVPRAPYYVPYIKMTTDSLSSELTFDEWRGVIFQRIIRPTLLLHVINHLLFLKTLRSGALICYHRRPISLLVPPKQKTWLRRCYDVIDDVITRKL